MGRIGGERRVVLVVVLAGLSGLACSNGASPGQGGLGGTGANGTGGVGGASADGNTNAEVSPGACMPGVVNPDSEPGGACAPDCQSVSCGKACTVDCCTTCGPNGEGVKVCSCRNPGGPYANCSCILPPGVSGAGPCEPQGYSTTTPPADAPPGSISLRGVACTKTNVICFTADSSPTSSRMCICGSDGTLHCGSVSSLRQDSGVPTPYN